MQRYVQIEPVLQQDISFNLSVYIYHSTPVKKIGNKRVMPDPYNKKHSTTHAETAVDKLPPANCRSLVRAIPNYLASKGDLCLGSFCSKFTGVLQPVNSFHSIRLQRYANLCVGDRIITLKSKQKRTKRFHQINVKLSPRDLSHKKFRAMKTFPRLVF